MAPRAQGQSLVVTTGLRSFPRAASPIRNENCFLQTQGNEYQVELKVVFPVPFWIPLSWLDRRHVNRDQTRAMEAPELGRAWIRSLSCSFMWNPDVRKESPMLILLGTVRNIPDAHFQPPQDLVWVQGTGVCPTPLPQAPTEGFHQTGASLAPQPERCLCLTYCLRVLLLGGRSVTLSSRLGCILHRPARQRLEGRVDF